MRDRCRARGRVSPWPSAARTSPCARARQRRRESTWDNSALLGTGPVRPSTTMTCSFSLSDFDFALPPELIAQHPAAERSASRLLDGRGDTPVDRVFRELPVLLREGDLLVFNDTKVIKARLLGAKSTGGVVEALVERVLAGNEVWAHLRSSKSPKAGATVFFDAADGGRFAVEVLGRAGPEDSLFHLRF